MESAEFDVDIRKKMPGIVKCPCGCKGCSLLTQSCGGLCCTRFCSSSVERIGVHLPFYVCHSGAFHRLFGATKTGEASSHFTWWKISCAMQWSCMDVCLAMARTSSLCCAIGRRNSTFRDVAPVLAHGQLFKLTPAIALAIGAHRDAFYAAIVLLQPVCAA